MTTLFTGKKSNTSQIICGRPRWSATSFLVLVVGVLFALVSGPEAQALDIFTLWQQPMIPLEMHEGAWADYRTQVMAGGRRSQGITRIACLDRKAGTDDNSWLIELLPLEEKNDGSLEPLPGEGLRLRISRSILKREGRLLDAVTDIVRWQDGKSQSTSVAELRNDPLLSASLEADFFPTDLEVGKPSTRVVQGQQYLCDHFVFSAADTQTAQLPAGTMVQASLHEVTAAVNSEIPFLGLAYVTERIRSESTLTPPSKKFSPPPPRVRVEIMELIGFGGGAQPTLLEVR